MHSFDEEKSCFAKMARRHLVHGHLRIAANSTTNLVIDVVDQCATVVSDFTNVLRPKGLFENLAERESEWRELSLQPNTLHIS